MVNVACPVCESDLIEIGKHHDLECLRCGNEFDKEDAKLVEVSMSELHARLVDIHSKIETGRKYK